MPKMYAMIGNTATKIKKRYAMIGNTATQVKKRYAMIGSTATLVYSAMPDYLYSVGDNVTDITGGWSKHDVLYTGINELTDWPHGPTGTVTFNNSDVVLQYSSSFGGLMINTSKAINFAEEGINSLTINCSTTIGGWGYHDDKWAAGSTHASWVFALVPDIKDEQAYTKCYVHDYGDWYINGESRDTRTEPFSKTLTDLKSLTGSYYVVVGIRRAVPGEFSMTLNSITCGE